MTTALPRTDEAKPWRSLWSETQMALHGSKVNQARQARGEPVINSLWFWGAGPMPADVPATVSGGFSRSRCVLYTDSRFAQELAAAAGVAHFPLQASDGLTLAESEYEQHLFLDVSLLSNNPDFVEQRELGALWSERIATMTAGVVNVSAELNGLTGCRTVFVPQAHKTASVLTRLAKLFTR